MRVLIETGRLPHAPASSKAADIGFANLARLGRPDVEVRLAALAALRAIGDLRAVNGLIRRYDALGAGEQAVRLAACALLFEMVKADFEISAAELAAMRRAVKMVIDIDDATADTLIELANGLLDGDLLLDSASFVGATTVRIHELGYEDRPPTPEELADLAAFYSRVGYKKTTEWKEEIVFFDMSKKPEEPKSKKKKRR